MPLLQIYANDDEESDSDGEDCEDCCLKGVGCINQGESFTSREIQRAKACRKLLHDLSTPSYKDLYQMIRRNLIKNIRAGCKDVVLAKTIFGKDVSVLKGKEVRPKPKIVTKNKMIYLSLELQIIEIESGIDVVYVESEIFLHAIGR